ncbi:MAG: type I glyceraldehyde-3-phosphate dehydrogenase [Nanoarchaeota archaeon]
MNIAINGFGRIGRTVLRICMERGVNVTAVNDPNGSDSAAYLLKYDTIYGKFPGSVFADKNNLIVNGKKIIVISERDPKKLPWKKLGIDIVIDSTGVFKNKESCSQHLKSGAKKVIITAPAKDVPQIVLGVNDKSLKAVNHIVAVSSCTTNCLAPIAKILNDNFGIKRALMTTIHAYTNDQTIQDSAHKKFRRGRAGAMNIIPTTTGAAYAVTEVIPELKDKITGLAVRVPVICGSLVDLSAELKNKFTVEQINAVFKKMSETDYKGIVEYSEDELVSSDIIANHHSALFDAKCTQKEGDMVKVLAWYDNEYGYSQRVVDVVKLIARFI